MRRKGKQVRKSTTYRASERFTPGVSHIYVGPCLACERAEQAPKHSICWMCGHVIDHSIGHPCPSGEDD